MHPKLVVAILVATAVAVYARAQGPNQVATAARRVVEIISRDPAKIETYCAVGKLSVQIEDANGAKDKKTADVLTEKMKRLEKQLGLEYLSLMDGLQTIDPDSDDGLEIEAMAARQVVCTGVTKPLKRRMSAIGTKRTCFWR